MHWGNAIDAWADAIDTSRDGSIGSAAAIDGRHPADQPSDSSSFRGLRRFDL